MNEALIKNWNDCVRPIDSVYHLGDFAFGKENIEIASRLNGNKKLILGNHDIHPTELYLKYFTKIFGAHSWRKCILTHIPIHIDNFGDRFLLNIHGHLHSKYIEQEAGIYTAPDLNYFNVSVESHDLKPVHSSLIIDRLNEI